MDMDMLLIGSRVKAARQAKRLTQDQLAEKLGFVSADSVGHIECGRSKPSLQTLIRIAKICEVSLDYLTGLVETPHETITSAVAKQKELTEAQTKMLCKIAESMVPFVKQLSE